jgi:Na+/H+ antiporter NhaC
MIFQNLYRSYVGFKKFIEDLASCALVVAHFSLLFLSLAYGAATRSCAKALVEFCVYSCLNHVSEGIIFCPTLGTWLHQEKAVLTF